ncbi:hemagglutinin repeat-containing protein, partial [Variovorax sp. MHTC-1]|uniref:hemagglutinin repeat-containing protein n=1 Tax=Variovorax sp. MHTC-1 TaxID=2495593 RepID=UPI000F931E2E
SFSANVDHFDNTGGTLRSGSLNIAAAGDLVNQDGKLESNGDASLSAGGALDNTRGTVSAAGSLTANAAGALDNSQGRIVSGGVSRIAAAGLDNSAGKVFGNSLSVDTHGQALTNAQGTMAATTTVNVQSGALNNSAGLIQSGGAMTVDTHGQALTNTNAASYATGQGGITSGGTLTLDSGALNNNAGFIGAKEAMVANTGTVINAGGGIVLGQSMVAINTRGATYDNLGGQTLAVGDLRIDAGAIDTTASLIRSLATTTLNAGTLANADTQGTDQGIEGRNVVINTGTLSNTSGAIRADLNTAITSGGSVDNTSGLISAADTLTIKDPNAANPAAKTLDLVNTNGTLVADKTLRIDAAKFSGDGRAVSGQDLSIALAQNIVNNADVAANGNLSYTTTGDFTNNGKLLAGETLAVGGNNVENTAIAEMSGLNTIVNAAGTLTNRGLIDSRGNTQIDAGTLHNTGTGRIYGSAVSIGVGTLDNERETVNGVASSATIASRGTLNIGADTINNREHALIFSEGKMSIGAALDANRQAIGQGSALNNLSAEIESIGDISISMAQINNRDVHIQRVAPAVSTSSTVRVAPVTPLGGEDFYPMDEVRLDPANGMVFHKNADGSGEALVGIGGYGIWNTTTTTTEDRATDLDPARIVAGGTMTLNGHLYNQDSSVTAGGAINVASMQPDQMQGQRTTTGYAIVTNHKGEVAPLVILSPTAETLSLGAYKYEENTLVTQGYNPGAASTANANANAGTPGIVFEVPAKTASGTGASQTIRTSTPNASVPTASLFNTRPDPGSRYLVETDPRFANYRSWLNSDYLLDKLGLNPDVLQKRLGDGFYEQRLIREQIAQLTGYRYLDGFTSDEDQYAALMNAGATFAQQYGLKPGIALTAAQMAQLTSDIVWLVEQTVTLPDGSTQRVLVPQLYVRVRPGDIDGSGALLSAEATVIKSSGDLVNTGTIAGRSMVSISAENVNNLGGHIAGGSVGINARTDIHNIGGSITADNAAVLTAGRDIDIRTTSQSMGGAVPGTNVDRIAGMYVSNPGGVLIASAGRDVNLIGAALVSAGSASVGAGRNINLGTVSEAGGASVFGQGIAGVTSQSREIGSVIQANDNVRLAAGNDLNIRAGAVASIDGALVATAKNDINLTAGQATSSIATATVSSSSSLLKKSSSSTVDSTSVTSVVSSSLSGNTVALVAGNDIDAQAAQLRSDEAMSLSAGRDISFTTATQTTQEAHASQSKTSATGLGSAIGTSLAASGLPGGMFAGAALTGGRSANGAEASTRNDAIGTTVSAGSLQMVSGRDTTLQAATVVADGDIAMIAGRNLTIESAQNTSVGSSYSADSKSGMIGTWYNPSVGNVKSSEAVAVTRTTQASSQVASLQGNVTLVAGGTYTQTASSVMAAGLAGPLVGGDVNILAKNVVINEAYNTEQSVTIANSSSTVMGGSASVGGISTDSLKGASSTIKAMGETSDGRMQALGTVNLAMSGKQAYDTAQALASGGSFGYKVSVNVNRNESQNTRISNSSQAVGSSVVGANNVNIVATGGGQDSNIHAVGSTIAAGNTVNLAADNNITLEASKNTSVTAGMNSSSGASLGVGFAAGAQNGVTIDLGVTRGKGSDNQNDISYNNTHVSGGKAVNVSAGGDLTLRGAVIDANRITADVGGNLSIESLQDVSVGQSRQSSSGLNVSLCIPPICYGVSTVGGSAASAKANGTFVSVGEQSGLKAGDGGFDVNVRGDTDLKGAVIESTQAAIDAGKNSFTTGGTVTMSDLQNVSQSSGSSYAVSGGVGFMAGGAESQQAAMRERGMSDDQIRTASDTTPNRGAGAGSSSSNQSSVTKAGISGIAGDQSVRTGDSSSAGTLIRQWNTQNIIRDVQAQTQISQEFNQKAPAAVATFAASHTRPYEDARRELVDAQRQLETESDATVRADLASKVQSLESTMAANQESYDKWKDGGTYRAAADILVAAAGGGTVTSLGVAVTRESLVWAADQMRQSMIEDSKKFPGICDTHGNCLDNKSGVSVGVNGDYFKLAGGRVDVEQLCGNNRCTINEVTGDWERDVQGRIN